jgi:hypothetical protein
MAGSQSVYHPVAGFIRQKNLRGFATYLPEPGHPAGGSPGRISDNDLYIADGNLAIPRRRSQQVTYGLLTGARLV